MELVNVFTNIIQTLFLLREFVKKNLEIKCKALFANNLCGRKNVMAPKHKRDPKWNHFQIVGDEMVCNYFPMEIGGVVVIHRLRVETTHRQYTRENSIFI